MQLTKHKQITIPNDQNYPAAEEAFNSNLQLPIYDSLKEREITLIASTLNKIFPVSR